MSNINNSLQKEGVPYGVVLNPSDSGSLPSDDAKSPIVEVAANALATKVSTREEGATIGIEKLSVESIRFPNTVIDQVLNETESTYDYQGALAAIRTIEIPESQTKLIASLQQMGKEFLIEDTFMTVVDLWLHYSVTRWQEILKLLRDNAIAKTVLMNAGSSFPKDSIYFELFTKVFYVIAKQTEHLITKVECKLPETMRHTVDSLCLDFNGFNQSLMKATKEILDQKQKTFSIIDLTTTASKVTHATLDSAFCERLVALRSELIIANYLMSYLLQNKLDKLLRPAICWKQIDIEEKPKPEAKRIFIKILENLAQFQRWVVRDPSSTNAFDRLLPIVKDKSFGSNNRVIFSLEDIMHASYAIVSEECECFKRALNLLCNTETDIKTVEEHCSLRLQKEAKLSRSQYIGLVFSNNLLKTVISSQFTDVASICNSNFINTPFSAKFRFVKFSNNLEQINYLLALVNHELSRFVVRDSKGEPIGIEIKVDVDDSQFQKCLERNDLIDDYEEFKKVLMVFVDRVLLSDKFEGMRGLFKLLEVERNEDMIGYFQFRRCLSLWKEYETALVLPLFKHINRIGKQLTGKIKERLKLDKTKQMREDAILLQKAIEGYNAAFENIYVALQMIDFLIGGVYWDRAQGSCDDEMRINSLLDFTKLLDLDGIKMDICEIDWADYLIDFNEESLALEVEQYSQALQEQVNRAEIAEETSADIDNEKPLFLEGAIAKDKPLVTKHPLSNKEKRTLRKEEAQKRIAALIARAKMVSATSDKSQILEIRAGMKRHKLIAQLMNMGIHHARTTGSHEIYEGGITIPKHGDSYEIKRGTLQGIQKQVEKHVNSGAGAPG